MMPERIGAGILRGGAEQHVDGGPVPRDRRTVLDRDAVLLAGALEQHVAVAGRDQDAAGADLVAILGLLDLHGADAVEPLGEGER